MDGIQITDTSVIIAKDTLDMLINECDKMLKHLREFLETTPHNEAIRKNIERYDRRRDILLKIKSGRVDYIN